MDILGIAAIPVITVICYGVAEVIKATPLDNNISAEAAFLTKCAAARVSGLDVHSVSLLDEEGKLVARKCFKGVG